MKIIVQGKDLDVTTAMRQHAKDQVRRKFDKFQDRINKVRIYLEFLERKDGDPHRATVTFKVDQAGKPIVVTKKANDIYKCIVSTANRALRQVRKSKEKKTSHTRRLAQNS